jgi:hypothetical protein
LQVRPRAITLIVDATFFRRRKDRDGLLLFLDSTTKQIVWYKFIQTETKFEYQEGLSFLLQNKYQIYSVTLDGKKGIKEVFLKQNIPVQICQFHFQQTILRKTTLNPKSDLGRYLKYLATNFIKDRWQQWHLDLYYELLSNIYKEFLNERNDKQQFRHRRLRSAMRSIKTSSQYLFTYQKSSSTSITSTTLKIPNTTNHIDGGVNTKIKELVRLHRGMSIQRRNKLIEVLLVSLGKIS